MQEYTTSTLSLHGAPAMQIVSGVTSNMLRVAKNPPPTLSPEAKRRLKWIEYYEAHDHNVSLTCRHFDISRPTPEFGSGLSRYDRHDLRSLENRKTLPMSQTQGKPKKRRRPTLSLAQGCGGGEGNAGAIPLLGEGQTGGPDEKKGPGGIDIDGG